jgi:cation transport protein ChaC
MESVLGEAMAKGEAGDLWVFGYGSLMWRPGFTFEESHSARLHGYHRALCVWSWVHRGVKARPGLVMGLDRGGACIGRAYRVAAPRRDAVVAYLDARERATPVYVHRWRPVTLPDGRRPNALFYGVDRRHPQFAGDLPDEVAVETVLNGVGISGANPDYLENMVEHLEEAGVRDPHLIRLRALVRARRAAASQ